MTQEEVIASNFTALLDIIKNCISEPRKSKLIKLYEQYGERMMLAPASSHSTRHNCYPGGYVDHVLRVCDSAEGLYKTWNVIFKNKLNSFTKEEMIFAALNHDLGKVGDLTEDYYVPNDSDWHVKRGQIYKINPKLNFMKVPDRSIYILQQAGIEISENEYLAIKLHDGLYSKGNESYLMAGSPEFALKTELPILLHHADHLSTLAEAVLNHGQKVETEPSEIKPARSSMKKINDPVVDTNLKDAFDQLFG
jgi:hypothetical protein